MRRGASGLILTFPTPEALCSATRRLRAAGFDRLEALMPHQDEAVEALFPPRSRPIPAIVLISGAVGAVGGLLMQLVPAAILYPTNIGNRPLASWPAFGPITFEIMALIAAIAVFFAFFIVSRLPMLDHPAFNAPEAARASQDRFILAVETADPAAARIGVERALEADPPLALTELWL
jgi:hypothetical protein